MFGIGIPELVIILIVALLVVGPAKLPDLARSMGKALGEFRRLADDVKETIEQEMAQEPEKEELTQKEGQKEEQKRESQEEQQKAEEPMAPVLDDGHLVAEEGETQEQTEEQRAEGGPAPQGLLFAEEEKKEELAEKIAEGIKVNEPQKT
jgi:Tat protein translocase TatB subunit